MKGKFLAGYAEGSKTREMHEQTLRIFEYYSSVSAIKAIDYNKAKGFRDWIQTQKSKHGRPYKPASINIHLRNLHTFFNEAKRAGFVVSNPFDEVKQVPDVKRSPRYLTKDQIRAVLKEAKDSWPPDKVLMLLFFLYTGIRLGEMINLRWRSIDLAQGIFYLHGSESWAPKDREEHAIGLHDELAKRLRRHPKTSEYVFPGLNGKRCRYSMARLLNRLYRRAGIKERGAHILRHSFATHSGLSIRALQKVLGHSDLKTTERYAHVTAEQLEGIRRISY